MSPAPLHCPASCPAVIWALSHQSARGPGLQLWEPISGPTGGTLPKPERCPRCCLPGPLALAHPGPALHATPLQWFSQMPPCHRHLATEHCAGIICCWRSRLPPPGIKQHTSSRQAPGTGLRSTLWVACLPRLLCPWVPRHWSVSQAVRAAALARECPGSTSLLGLPLKVRALWW